MANYNDCPIFVQLSEEMCPGWFGPIEPNKIVKVQEVTVNGKKGWKLMTPLRDIYAVKRPPWVS